MADGTDGPGPADGDGYEDTREDEREVSKEGESGRPGAVDGGESGEDEREGDRLLNALGVVLAAFIVVGIVGVVLAGMGGPSTDVADAPDAEWTLDRVNDSHVRITHRGGDAVPAADLVVTVDGVRRRVSWDGLVAEGDAGTVRAGQGMIVDLYWTNDVGERIELRSWQDV
jgi:hypothetical protein